MLSVAQNSQADTHRKRSRGYALQSRQWVGVEVGRGGGACAQFEDGAVSVCTDHSSLSVAGKYGVLTVDAQGGYSYALHKSIGKGIGRDAFVYVGEEPCVYVLEPLWFATEVFHINNNPTGRAESHQVVVSIAVR